MIKITIDKNTRMVDISKSLIGVDGENLQDKLVFQFDEFVNGIARLEYILPDNTSNFIMLRKENNTYTTLIRNVLTKTGKIIMQLVITQDEELEGIPIFKSKEFYLVVSDSINASIEAPEEYNEWIDIANSKLASIDVAIEQCNNLNIDASKNNGIANIQITKKDGTTKQVEIHDGEKGDKGDKGGCNFATFEFDEHGNLIANYDDDLSKIQFEIVNGNLEVIING